MDFILVNLEKVRNNGRMDYDFYNPNQRKIADFVKKNYNSDFLGNLCLKITTGKTAPRNSYPEEGIRIIKVKNTTGNGINWDKESFVNPYFFEKAKEKARVQERDILMLCSAHNKSYIGRCDIIDKFPRDVIKDNYRCCCVGELIIIRANSQKVIPEYLLTFLRLPIIQEEIIRMVKGQSAHLYPTELAKLRIVLPPRKTQKKIAKLNTIAQKEFLEKIKKTKKELELRKREIEKLILNRNMKLKKQKG